LCTTCVAKSGLARRFVCFRCGLPSPLGRTCAECVNFTVLRGVSVGAFYEGGLKEMILKLKFYRLRAAAEVAAEVILGSLPEDLMVDMVTSVPVAAERYRERGYNQSELVARVVARRLGLPYRGMLGRFNAAHQMGLGRASRLEQIKGAFYALRRMDGQRVLVVDDVVTTGATLAECAETLVGAGAESVWGAAVARH
jgi:competence protein ComFC